MLVFVLHQISEGGATLSQNLGYFVPVLNVNSGCELWEGGLVFCGIVKTIEHKLHGHL